MDQDSMKKCTVKKSLCKVGIVFLCILTAFVYLHPWHIERSVSGLIIDLHDPNYVRETSIEIDGQYHVNLLQKDTYTGIFRISSEPMSSDPEFFVRINHKDGELIAYAYTDEKSGDEMFYPYGELFSGFLLKNICIAVANPSVGGGGRCLCFAEGAEDYQDALKKLSRYHWFSYMKEGLG